MVRRLIHFLVYSNIWIGLGAAAIVWQYYLLTNQEPNYILMGFALASTILTYTFQRYVKILNKTFNGGDRFEWMVRHSILVKGLMVLGTVGTIYTLLKMSLPSYFLLIFMGFLSFFYVVKLPGKIGRNLRDVPSLKIFLIGLVWGLTGSFLPWYNQSTIEVEMPWYILIADFIFVIAITIPFDIRDIERDEKEKKTIPQLIGETGATYLAMLLLLLNTFFLYFIADKLIVATLIISVIALLMIKKSHHNRGDLYFSFWIDGLLIAQPLALYVDLYLLEGLI